MSGEITQPLLGGRPRGQKSTDPTTRNLLIARAVVDTLIPVIMTGVLSLLTAESIKEHGNYDKAVAKSSKLNIGGFSDLEAAFLSVASLSAIKAALTLGLSCVGKSSPKALSKINAGTLHVLGDVFSAAVVVGTVISGPLTKQVTSFPVLNAMFLTSFLPAVVLTALALNADFMDTLLHALHLGTLITTAAIFFCDTSVPLPYLLGGAAALCMFANVVLGVKRIFDACKRKTGSAPAAGAASGQGGAASGDGQSTGSEAFHKSAAGGEAAPTTRMQPVATQVPAVSVQVVVEPAAAAATAGMASSAPNRIQGHGHRHVAVRDDDGSNSSDGDSESSSPRAGSSRRGALVVTPTVGSGSGSPSRSGSFHELTTEVGPVGV